MAKRSFLPYGNAVLIQALYPPSLPGQIRQLFFDQPDDLRYKPADQRQVQAGDPRHDRQKKGGQKGQPEGNTKTPGQTGQEIQVEQTKGAPQDLAPVMQVTPEQQPV